MDWLTALPRSSWSCCPIAHRSFWGDMGCVRRSISLLSSTWSARCCAWLTHQGCQRLMTPKPDRKKWGKASALTYSGSPSLSSGRWPRSLDSSATSYQSLTLWVIFKYSTNQSLSCIELGRQRNLFMSWLTMFRSKSHRGFINKVFEKYYNVNHLNIRSVV